MDNTEIKVLSDKIAEAAKQSVSAEEDAAIEALGKLVANVLCNVNDIAGELKRLADALAATGD
jgi:hypothetical protein